MRYNDLLLNLTIDILSSALNQCPSAFRLFLQPDSTFPLLGLCPSECTNQCNRMSDEEDNDRHGESGWLVLPTQQDGKKNPFCGKARVNVKS